MLLKKRINYVNGFEVLLENDVIFIHEPEGFHFDMEDVGKSFVRLHANKLIRGYCEETDIKYNSSINIKNDEPIGIVEHLAIGDTNNEDEVVQHYTVVMLYAMNKDNGFAIYLGSIAFVYDTALKDDCIFNIRIDCSNELPIIKEQITDKVICDNLMNYLKGSVKNSLLDL